MKFGLAEHFKGLKPEKIAEMADVYPGDTVALSREGLRGKYYTVAAVCLREDELTTRDTGSVYLERRPEGLQVDHGIVPTREIEDLIRGDRTPVENGKLSVGLELARIRMLGRGRAVDGVYPMPNVDHDGNPYRSGDDREAAWGTYVSQLDAAAAERRATDPYAALRQGIYDRFEYDGK